jgi:hypothetical protein
MPREFRRPFFFFGTHHEAENEANMQTSLPFGAHKGRGIDTVPADYLDWLLTLPDLFPQTRRIVQHELDRRTIQRIDLGKPEQAKPADRRLLVKGWLYSRSTGRYSRWFNRGAKTPGWACYMVSRGVARAVQHYLDALRSAKQGVAA